MIDTDKLYDVEVDSDGTPDRQKFSNCYISYAMIFDEEFQINRELTDEELESLIDIDSYWCHKQFEKWLF